MDNARIFSNVFLLILRIIPTSIGEPIRGNDVSPAKNNEYPFVVSIGNRDSRFDAVEAHFCTGVLISKEHVLTAAHCFKGHLLGEIKVVLGSVDLTNATQCNPSTWITYDQWAEKRKISKEFQINDIAIIKLSEKVDKGIARPVGLSFEKPSYWQNKTAIVAGWGYTSLESKSSRYLRKANVNVLANDECESEMLIISNKPILMKKSYFCTRIVPYTLIDCGDSGGPVLNEKNNLLGVNLGTCPKTEFPYPRDFLDSYQVNVHASVHYYRKFIEDVVKNY